MPASPAPMGRATAYRSVRVAGRPRWLSTSTPRRRPAGRPDTEAVAAPAGRIQNATSGHRSEGDNLYLGTATSRYPSPMPVPGRLRLPPRYARQAPSPCLGRTADAGRSPPTRAAPARAGGPLPPRPVASGEPARRQSGHRPAGSGTEAPSSRPSSPAAPHHPDAPDRCQGSPRTHRQPRTRTSTTDVRSRDQVGGRRRPPSPNTARPVLRGRRGHAPGRGQVAAAPAAQAARRRRCHRHPPPQRVSTAALATSSVECEAPDPLDVIDFSAVTELTGNPVRGAYQAHGRRRPADLATGGLGGHRARDVQRSEQAHLWSIFATGLPQPTSSNTLRHRSIATLRSHSSSEGDDHGATAARNRHSRPSALPR